MDEKGGRGRFQRIKQLASEAKGIINISGISESRSAAITGLITKARDGQVLVVTSSYGRAKKLAEDLSFFVDKKIILMPDEEQSFISFDAKSHHNLLGRLSALTALAKGENCIVVAPVFAAAKRLLQRACSFSTVFFFLQEIKPTGRT